MRWILEELGLGKMGFEIKQIKQIVKYFKGEK